MQVLEGIRVIDVTSWAFVPSAGCVLAHWGADVVKVENPRACDPMRLLGGTTDPGGAGVLFKHYNRGKRAVAIDIASDEGREILYRLVESADVFLTSFLTATRKKLGIDVDDIRACNPRIIYAKGTGQGPRGPEAERGGYDGATWWCRGSLADAVMKVSGADWPTGMIGHGDGMSGMTLAGGISAALLQRERTGATPVVDASLLGTAVWFNGPAIIQSKAGNTGFAGGRPPRNQQLAGLIAYRTKDGRFLQLLLLNDHDADWIDMCRHLERSDLATDPRFATTAARAENRAELVGILDEVFAQRTYDEWKSILVTTRGVWAPVQTAAEIHEDPQTLANGFVRDVQYPDGPLSLVVPPILFDEEAGDPQRAPDFCEHTEDVLGAAGYDAATLATYREAGVIA